jgi:replicative DNA helicase Mcm
VSEVDSATLVERLKKFFGRGSYVNSGKNYTDLNPKQYWDELDYISGMDQDQKSLYVEFRHIEAFDREVAEYLLFYPDEWLSCATDAISEIDFTFNQLTDIKVRVIGLPQTSEVAISKLRDVHLGKFLALRCVISKASEVRPAFETAAFMCLRCGHITLVEQTKSDSLEEPFAGCENSTCGKKGPFKLSESDSVMYNHQYLKVQEPVENLRGKQPEFLNVSCADEIAGITNPGDKVIITGILKGKPKMIREGRTKFLDFIFIANAIEKSDADYENIEILPEDLEKINQMKEDGTLKDKILGSVAPSIFGLEDIKLGIALQLFGGMPVELPDGTRKRGDIHILMVGDPGCGKSQILDFVSKFAPRAVSFSGKSSSEAGLTGAAVKDELDGKWWIQPGALTLADGGVCCADEVEKMKAGALGSIHEALEQQMVHIQKAVKADLWTRTAFLGAANPKYGRYDRYEPIVEQITHGDAFISRMDLLFILQDKPNVATDTKLASHILGVLRGKKSVTEPAMDLELFRKCIAYARTNIFPELTDESQEFIIRFFVGTREAAGGKTDTIPITARTLEAAFRLSTAHARMRLSNVIEEEDAREAIKLLEANLRNVGIDPDTGELDANIMEGCNTRSQEKRMKKIKEIIKELSSRDTAYKQSAKKEEVLEKCKTENIRDPEGLIKKLKSVGDILCPKEGYYKLV